mmetsp:Transcript_25542/g.59470  ORF Transcript_25542/g.59470 Transcript_25542/m.59470 type:complete len:441 (-) Transcript_25542:220-1542(-)
MSAKAKQTCVDASGPTSHAEAALEAWLDCSPQGYWLEAARLPELLPEIAAHVPNRSPGSLAKELSQLFASDEKGLQPIFVEMLRVHNGMVHFLHFWKAFTLAARLADTGKTGPGSEEGLYYELETLRDSVLRILDAPVDPSSESGGEAASSSSSSPSKAASSSSSTAAPAQVSFWNATVPTMALVEEVHRTATMSAYPRFWQRVAESVSNQLEIKELDLEGVTSILLSWLHDVILWQREAAAETQASIVRTMSRDADGPSSQEPRLPVRLHIYDVSQEESIQRINKWLAHTSSPVKIGGVFHAGVEVNGLEWSYGFSFSESSPGISCVEPKEHPQHHYRQTVNLRQTKLTAEQIAAVLSDLIEEYPGYDYDLLRRNCCHFADDFCRRLGVGGIPGWVHRLARIGAQVDTAIQAAQSVKERFWDRPPADGRQLSATWRQGL